MAISHIVTGVINWDKTIFVKKFPKQGEEVEVERIVDVPGGKGANVAVADPWKRQSGIIRSIRFRFHSKQTAGNIKK